MSRRPEGAFRPATHQGLAYPFALTIMVGWAGVLTGGCATAGVLAWAAYHPASTLFGRTIRFASSDRTIALTFDDGPNPAVTPRLLELLERHQARATF